MGFSDLKPSEQNQKNGRKQAPHSLGHNGLNSLIELKRVNKVYKSEAGGFSPGLRRR